MSCLCFILSHLFSQLLLPLPGGGGALKKVLYGEAPPQALTPYPCIYHFHRNCTPFVYLLLKKGTPFIYLKDLA